MMKINTRFATERVREVARNRNKREKNGRILKFTGGAI